MTRAPSVPLGEVTAILSGFAFDSANFGDTGTMPVVRIRDVIRGRSSTFYNGSYDARYVVSDGDFLIGMDGEFNCARWAGGAALLNQRVSKIAPSTANLHEGYLRHYLPRALKVIEDSTPFATVKHLSVKSIRAIAIPLPPLPEQRRVADILDRADAMHAKRRAALAQLGKLTQSVFLDMFGDPDRNSMGWPVMNLGELVASGPQNGVYKPSTEYGTGIPILRIDAFYDGQVLPLSGLRRVRLSDQEILLYGLREDDIVINRVNSKVYLGKSAIIPALAEPTVFESNMMRFGLDLTRLVPRYLVEFLQTPMIKAQIASAAKDAVNQSSINQTDVKNFRVNVPSLEIQHEFCRRTKLIGNGEAALAKSLTYMEELYASLQHGAFQGEP